MKAKRVFAWILFLGWLGLAIFLSSQSRAGSSEISEGLAGTLYSASGWLFGKISLYRFHYYLRKVAHVALHFGVGFLGYFAFAQVVRGYKKPLLLALIVGVTVAVFDEVIQSQVSGRVAIWTDGVLNLLGILSGAVIATLIFKARLR